MKEQDLTDHLMDMFKTAVVQVVRRQGPDLSMRQLGMFLTCYLKSKPETVRGLLGRLDIPRPAISRGIERLSKLGLVRLETDPLDHRTVLIHRNASGIAFYRALDKILLAAALGLKIPPKPKSEVSGAAVSATPDDRPGRVERLITR